MPSRRAARGSLDAAQLAADYLGKLGGPGLKRIGIGGAFLLADADELLGSARPGAAPSRHKPLERLRARKTPEELEYLRMASDLVVDLDARRRRRAWARMPRNGELTEALRREEVNRGLTFEYCLITDGN